MRRRGRAISAAGPTHVTGAPAAQDRRGFTLLEILLAVALLALMSAALISGAVHAIDGQPKRPEDVFWAASQTARRQAMHREHEFTLSYDTKEKAFVVTDGAHTQTFAIPKPKGLTVDLLQPASTGNSSVLIGGELVETRKLPRATYYPDGTCRPFRVQFRTDGPARVVAIDPWTCAPVLRSGNDRS